MAYLREGRNGGEEEGSTRGPLLTMTHCRLETIPLAMALSFTSSVPSLPITKGLLAKPRYASRKLSIGVRAQALAVTPETEVPKDANALLSPYTMGPFELAHRVVLAPLTRCRALSAS